MLNIPREILLTCMRRVRNSSLYREIHRLLYRRAQFGMLNIPHKMLYNCIERMCGIDLYVTIYYLFTHRDALATATTPRNTMRVV